MAGEVNGASTKVKILLNRTQVFLFFLMAMGHILFFLLYFFAFKTGYSILASSMASMLLTLAFKYSKDFRDAMILSIIDYGGYFANLLLWMLLTSVILHGPCLRLQQQFYNYKDSISCTETTYKDGMVRSYQEGLNHLHSSVLSTLGKWNYATANAADVLRVVGDEMIRIADHVDSFSKLIQNIRSMCFYDVQSAVNYCVQTIGTIVKACKIGLPEFIFLCEPLYAPSSFCQLMLGTNMCHPGTYNSSSFQISEKIRDQAQVLKTALDLHIESGSTVELHIDYSDFNATFNDAVMTAKRAVSASTTVWKILGVAFALAFLTKPMANLISVRNYSTVVEPQSLFPDKISKGRLLMCLIYGGGCVVIYAVDVLTACYMCRSPNMVPHTLTINASFVNNVNVSGGIVAKSVAAALMDGLQQASNVTSDVNIYDCVPVCTEDVYFLEMVAVACLLTGSIMSLFLQPKLAPRKLRLLRSLRANACQV